eukprot:11041814-Lingulodinium_polyedra.AAC.1
MSRCRSFLCESIASDSLRMISKSLWSLWSGAGGMHNSSIAGQMKHACQLMHAVSSCCQFSMMAP